MATETMPGSTKPVTLLHRAQSTNFAIGAAVSGMARVTGRKTIKGNVHVSTASAAGYPRIRQSTDGVVWSLVDVIAVDGGQPDFQYPFEIEVKLPYVQIQYTQGVALSTFLYVQAQVV